MKRLMPVEMPEHSNSAL